jgi:hypothetical protein
MAFCKKLQIPGAEAAAVGAAFCEAVDPASPSIKLFPVYLSQKAPLEGGQREGPHRSGHQAQWAAG